MSNFTADTNNLIFFWIPNCHLDSLPIVISSEVEKSNEISPLTTFGRDDQKREGVNFI